MPKDWSAQISTVNFRCGSCRHAFEGEPDLVEQFPEQEHHPFRYYAHCPACGEQHQPQASWERALLKAHQLSTGPRTAEGLAATTANLAGHPTPDEALRTRFNGMKHGAFARTATYFPAKPGGYSFCDRCDVDRGWCREQPACVKQTEIFMLHHAAFDRRDPRVLKNLHADMHAALMATLQMCIQEVLGLGVLIKAPKVELDREGNAVALTYTDAAGKKQYIYQYTANPAFKPLSELLTRMGLSMSDLGMTVKAVEEDEEQGRGQLSKAEDARETLADFGQRMLQAMSTSRDQIAAAQLAKQQDPVLIEHKARGGDR